MLGTKLCLLQGRLKAPSARRTPYLSGPFERAVLFTDIIFILLIHFTGRLKIIFLNSYFYDLKECLIESFIIV